MKKHIWKKILGVICIGIATVIWMACKNADPFMEYNNFVLQLFFNCGWGIGLASILAVAGFILIFGIEWLIKLIDLINGEKPARKR